MKKVDLGFINILLPFLCILLIPVILWNISNLYVVNENNDKALSVTMDAMENYINQAEGDLSQIETYVYSVAQNPSLKSFFFDTDSEITYSDMRDYQTILATYNISDLPIYSAYIYNRASDVLIAPEASYRKSEDFYLTKLRSEAEEKNMWNEKMLAGGWKNGYSTVGKFLSNGKELSLLQYCQSVPLARRQNVYSNITVLIDAEKLLKPFDALYKSGGVMRIYDENNICIYSNSEKFANVVIDTSAIGEKMEYAESKADGEKFCRLLYKSQKNGWSYAIYVPQGYIFSDSHKVNTVLVMFALIAFILAGLISVYFTYGRNKTYTSIKEMLGIKDEPINKGLAVKTNEMDFYQTHIKKLLSEKQDAQIELSKAKELNWESALHMIFYKRFNDEKTAKEVLESAKISLKGSMYAVFVVYMPKNESISLKEQMIEKLRRIFHDAYTYQADTVSIGVLFSFNEAWSEFKENFENELSSKYPELYRSNEVFFGVGCATNELSKIYSSFDQAKQVAKYSYLVNKKDIIFYESLPPQDNVYSYTLEDEARLVNSVRDANLIEARGMLKKLYNKNFVENMLKEKEIRRLFESMHTTFNHLQQFLKKTMFICDLDTVSTEEFFEKADAFVEKACMEIYENKEEFVNFEKYVVENYQNPDFSLQMMSEHFNIQSSYISKLFKKHTGVNFFAYLEQLRIERACALLTDEKLPIKQIAIDVGYANDLTFRRAFKKCKGVSPSAYKKLN